MAATNGCAMEDLGGKSLIQVLTNIFSVPELLIVDYL